MGKFGSEAYFEGPIETKSMIMTPAPALLDLGKMGKATGTSTSKAKKVDVPEGLQGEVFNHQVNQAALDSDISQLRSDMSSYIDANGGEIPMDFDQKFGDRIKSVQYRQRVLESELPTMKKNLEISSIQKQYYEKQGPAFPAADPFGGLMKREDGSIITLGDLSRSIDESPNVSNVALGYTHPDTEYLRKVISKPFSEASGSNQYGVEQKQAFLFNAMAGIPFEEAIRNSGFSGMITTSNKTAMNAAYNQVQYDIANDTKARRAYEYGFNLFKLNNEGLDDKTAKAEYNKELFSGQVPMNKKTSYSFTNPLTLGGYGDNKPDQTQLSPRAAIYMGNIPGREVVNVTSVKSERNLIAPKNITFDHVMGRKESSTIDSGLKELFKSNPDIEKEYNSAREKIIEYETNADAAKASGNTDLYNQEHEKAIALGNELSNLVSESLGYSKMSEDELKSKFGNIKITSNSYMERGRVGFIDAANMSPSEALYYNSVNIEGDIITKTVISDAKKSGYHALREHETLPSGTKIKFAGSSILDTREIPVLNKAIINKVVAQVKGTKDENGTYTQMIELELLVPVSARDDLGAFGEIMMDDYVYMEDDELQTGRTIQDIFGDDEESRLAVSGLDDDGNPNIGTTNYTADYLEADTKYMKINVLVVDDYYNSDMLINTAESTKPLTSIVPQTEGVLTNWQKGSSKTNVTSEYFKKK